MQLPSKQVVLAESVSKKFLCYCQQLLPTAAQCGISLTIPFPDLVDTLRDEMTTSHAWAELMAVQAEKEGESCSNLQTFRDLGEKVLAEFLTTLNDVYRFDVRVSLPFERRGDYRVPEKKVYTWVDLLIVLHFDPLRLNGLNQLESFVADFRG